LTFTAQLAALAVYTAEPVKVGAAAFVIDIKAT